MVEAIESQACGLEHPDQSPHHEAQGTEGETGGVGMTSAETADRDAVQRLRQLVGPPGEHPTKGSTSAESKPAESHNARRPCEVYR